MARKVRTGSKKPAAKKRRIPTALDETLAPETGAPLQGRVIERPDGFYWEKSKGESFGPFATLAEAEAEMLAGGGVADVEAESLEAPLQEAESELGISEWIDPDTGGPAEDNVPRIEDH